MTTKPLSNWQVSCERLNSALGYIPSNVKLVCLEFNTGNGQWSREQVQQIDKLIKRRVNLTNLKQRVEEAKAKPNPKVLQKKRKPSITKDGIELLHCTNCDEYLDKSNFCKDRQALSSQCRDCTKVKFDAYRQTLRGFVKRLLHHVEKHVAKISKNNKRSKENSEFTLTLENVLQKIIDQKGRCAYSGIPLAFTLNSSWRMSIERINNRRGYTIDNIVLICIEFNTGDNSWQSEDAEGSCQWSKAKVEYFLKNMKI